MQSIRVWDLPIRLFHWLLVLAVVGLFVTGKVGGNWMEWHTKLGYFTLGLITFRVVWGVIGGFHARFVNFVRGPSTVLQYFKSLIGKSPAMHFLGHNPMGALSTIALILVVGFQAVSGLFADDEILLQGPYASIVPSAFSSLMTKLHHWNSNLIIGLVALHVAAILFYVFVKKENLVKAMFTGKKSVESIEPSDLNANEGGHPQAEMPETARPAWLFVVVALIVAALTWAVVTKAFFK
jgi:cytochrome b